LSNQSIAITGVCRHQLVHAPAFAAWVMQSRTLEHEHVQIAAQGQARVKPVLYWVGGADMNAVAWHAARRWRAAYSTGCNQLGQVAGKVFIMVTAARTTTWAGDMPR